MEKKRRAKDGLPLKARTKADYLAMVDPGRISAKDKQFADGALHPLADKLLAKLTAHDIRGVYEIQRKRSERQAVYAMQVLRALLRWHGVHVADSPLGRDTAGRDRIEIHGNKLHGYPPILVGDVDHFGGKIVLRDTKNRSDHKLLLARQALQIVAQHCQGRASDEALFPIVDARKTLAWINAQAGTTVQGHGLRATFASIAEELVSVGVLKRMMNHAAGGDVTLGHCVGKSEAQLRAGWQTVADFIDAAAAQAPAVQPGVRRVRLHPAREVDAAFGASSG